MTASNTGPAEPPRPDGVRDWDAEEERAEAQERGRRGDRRWWVVGVLAVVVMSLMAVIWGLSATVGRVHWVDTGFEVVSDSRVDVRFDLRRDPSREAVCRLEAQATSHVVVGRTEVRVPAAQSSPSRHVESVTTASPAVTGYVEECWYADGAPRR
ncbi:hypothetical protein BJF86_01060 [Serinicoccus sp. CNJ-927]|uniref:DUF4307 domain-containing protein n=1 Tax=unclassified Serinicoccus TaxID=2643101 RepID=UPI00095BFC8F|nr:MULTISPECIES: DUF4307 domain-containing protein [unclassified Serinicoccus]OLT19186.1 hypothetical protein BJF80_12790 [Serinicoccus sp. CUA-874]OLT43417.1 hypothetical protein BJF86_01060 [Serinicoccus sp. CNJ-927]